MQLIIFFTILWFLGGVVTSVCLCIEHLKKENEITLKDLFVFFMITLCGLISVLSLLILIASEKCSDIVIYKRKENEYKKNNNE